MNTVHIHIKKNLLIFAVLALTLLLSFGAYALTDASSIEFTMGVEPAVLSAPGSVTVKLNIKNLSQEDITVPMTLYDADGVLLASAFDGGTLALLKAGESQSWEGKWTVSQKHLDAGKIAFNLRLNTQDASGVITQISLEAFASLQFQGEKVALEVSRAIVPEIIRPAGTLTVTYTLSNTGTVKLTDIRVRENNLIATAAQTVPALEPGGTASVTFTKKVGSAGVESSAVIDYKREGVATALRETVPLVKIPLARPGFSAVLSSSSTAITIGEKVTLTLLMKNAGNISYTSIKVTDPKLGDVFTNLSLPAGEELSLSKEITLMSPTAFKFTLALEDNSGVKQSETTNEVKVSAYDQGQIMRLNVQIAADREAVESLPGLVRFDILITNDSNYAAKPVNVYAGETRIASVEELKPGQSITVTRDFSISQAGKFGFTVRTVDALGVTQSFKSNETLIAFNPPTAAPTKEIKPTIAPVVTFSPVPAQGNDTPLGKASNALFIVVAALGVLFGGTFLLFLASSAARARARKQSESAYDHLEVVHKRDYTDPSTYQGGDDAPQAAETAAAASQLAGAPAEEQKLPHEKYLEDEKPAETAAVPMPEDETAGYQLVRGDDEKTADNGEQRTRRAAKHQKPADDEE